jgi:hypothetical protein
MNNFFQLPELVLAVVENLDPSSFLSFARTNKANYKLLRTHQKPLCPKVLKNSDTFKYWERQWVADKNSTMQPKNLNELSQMYLRHEVGRLELEMIRGEERNATTTEGAYRKRILLTIIGTRLREMWRQGCETKLDSVLKDRRYMAMFNVLCREDGAAFSLDFTLDGLLCFMDF